MEGVDLCIWFFFCACGHFVWLFDSLCVSLGLICLSLCFLWLIFCGCGQISLSLCVVFFYLFVCLGSFTSHWCQLACLCGCFVSLCIHFVYLRWVLVFFCWCFFVLILNWASWHFNKIQWFSSYRNTDLEASWCQWSYPSMFCLYQVRDVSQGKTCISAYISTSVIFVLI